MWSRVVRWLEEGADFIGLSSGEKCLVMNWLKMFILPKETTILPNNWSDYRLAQDFDISENLEAHMKQHNEISFAEMTSYQVGSVLLLVRSATRLNHLFFLTNHAVNHLLALSLA